jgi:AcrR family transcriptional regulator
MAPAPVVPVPVTGGACATRPLRADARRNRERILRAARTVFAETGVEAQIDDVAKRAKVGVGTVYRHFPTKEALLDALIRDRFEEIAGYAREALLEQDAWEGFCRLIWRSAERNAADRAFCEAVALRDQSAVVEETGLLASMSELMERARASGRLRADATTDDIPIIMCGAGSVMRTIPAPEVWRRYVSLMLDGMRAA